MMNLFDTRTQTISPFVAGQTVRLYVCGITPYDSAHLGHAFVYTVFDVLIRHLQAKGHEVIYVRNVTDLDDDTIRTAKARGVHYQVLARGEAAQCNANLRRLGLLAPTVEPYVTDTVDAIIPFIEGLLARNVAYQLDDHRVYVDTNTPAYLAFSRLDEASALDQFREKGGDPDAPGKRQPLDFLLWQPSAEGEPAWDAPWGRGRPGWHIECSAMGQRHLGNTIDIHGGGSDLIFPHHEAEIMQMEGLTGQQPFCQVWMHTGMVALDGVKMSKSLGNLVFLADLLESCHPDAIRALLLSHHYRQDWTYTPEAMAEAQRRVARWHGLLDGRLTSQITPAHLAGLDADTRAKIAPCLAALDDDLNTPAALDHLDALADAGDLDALLMAGGVMGFFMPKAFNAVAG